MNRLLLLFVPLLLVACVSQETSVPPSKPHAPAITVVDGPATAEALTRRYNDTRANCGSDSMPAFLCSGVIIRATTYSDAYDTWDPSPVAERKGSVSFSYLRKDNNFQSFAWAPTNPNGFIFYPIFDMPPGKLDIPILCHFPMDGWTDGRTERYGCGIYPGVAGSQPCHQQNITTGAQWVARFPPGTVGNSICGFDVRDELNHYAGPNFYAAMQAKWLNTGYFREQNEMLVQVWPKGQGAALPIQAFFYATPAGLDPARKSKQRFLSKTGIDLPIIKVTLPTVASGSATFQYIAGDQ
ncbi:MULTISPECIES: halovibrin HvnA [Pseudomonas]|uniref:halovibrin HvnA n=1 Tax=Pseudomonas TaxID=286 RepID=UPI001647C249|nr:MULTISPECIES: halovibrin HvnA [Pseudomonas]QXI46427.1 halovibrin HvnA [Pseudomonas anuradhapurensis]